MGICFEGVDGIFIGINASADLLNSQHRFFEASWKNLEISGLGRAEVAHYRTRPAKFWTILALFWTEKDRK